MANSSQGMTLVEAVVWIFVFTLVMGAIVLTVIQFYRANQYAIEQAFAVTSAQQGLENIMRSIREAAYSSQGAFPVVSIAANDFVFYADMDSDALIERVHYFLQGTDLMRGVLEATGNPPDYTGAEATSRVADYVRNTEASINVFKYYDELGAEITNYANWTTVRFVKVTLAVNINVVTLPNQFTLSSSAAIRNLAGK
ncbi:MAG: hypothetical protein Q8R25_02415 [bacterium]|nr:hypothetical protein [bacterium]